MRKIIVNHDLIKVFLLLFYGIGLSQGSLEKGAYLDQNPPGLVPEKFAPGLISTEANELNCVFTPDLKECFFTVWENGINTIVTVKYVNNQWSKRLVAPFSGNYSDVDPYVTPDGKRLYFSSMRPLESNGESKDSDLWYVEKNADNEWGNLIHLGTLNSKGKDDYYTSMTQDGTIYFSIFETHGSPGDIYRSKLVNGVYATPERVENSISTDYNEHDPYIATDGSYLIFTSDRPGGIGRGDLYISYKNADGAWTKSKNMGEKINSIGYDFCPMLSPDGKYLFFTRNINRNGDIYWISAEIIELFKPDTLK